MRGAVRKPREGRRKEKELHAEIMKMFSERASRDAKFTKWMQKAAYKELHKKMTAVKDNSLLFTAATELARPSLMLEALNCAWPRIKKQQERHVTQ